MAISVLGPATSLRLTPGSTLRLLSFYPKSNPSNLPDEGLDRVGKTIVVMGWVRTLRVQSSVTFIEVNDGSCLSNMQCVMDLEAEGYDQVETGLVTTGASIWVQGTVVKSQGSKQKVELKVIKIVAVGKSDPSYPIQKKRVARVRNALAYATHKFFQENGFVWVSSPIITASDCEGAGEQFCVTTLIPGSQEAANSPVDGIPKTKDGLIDWSQVYTFGPTFRAENSNTSRHLAEFWDVAEKDFVQLTYTDAIELLLKAKKKFEFPDIKAFYMRQNDDGKTVAAMDLLVPRKERLEYLEDRLDELKLNKQSFWWYLDLRRYGSVPHAGFGLGFERLAIRIKYRDAIPFPRVPGSAEF
uniref:Aminoacyl-transfer RNA synthetases class-II family profile domain-containing protein n=1 Tax=Salix viminalis TaxID=40686 RepID=A0A6N2MK87_SALVM